LDCIIQSHIDWGPSGCGAEVIAWPYGLSGNLEIIGEGYYSDPAIALIEATLDVMIKLKGLHYE
jgi:hypothetical protein